VSEPAQRSGPAKPDAFARLQKAIPLLVVYFALAALYAWQASHRPVPTIFSDENEMAQLSRAIAHTGEAARRGVPYGLASLVAYFLAPVWWLGTTAAQYSAAKLLLVLTMTATVFPAYALARLVVSPWYALAAAGGATAVPALAYSPILVEEPLAYPLATLALFLIARALVRPGWRTIVPAVIVSAAAAATRTQLAVLFAVLVLGLLWIAWQSERGHRWRSTWSTWDWVGTAALVVGVAFAFSAVMSHLSTSWRNTTLHYKDRIFDHGASAIGALAIGIGILPLVAGIAALARPKDEPYDPKTRAFVTTTAAALVTFVWYAGIKGAYLSTVFATQVVERNVIYLAPPLFASTALAIERGVGRWWTVGVAAVFTIYVVASTPLELDNYPYYEAHGLSIAAFANRVWGWPHGRIEAALIVVCVLAIAVVLALRWLRRGSTAFRVVAGVAAVVVVAWGLTAEVYAANGERRQSQQIDDNLPGPHDWVDRATGGASTVVLGQQITDPKNIQETEFFNTSIRKMWSLDGTAINVGGPILTPDLAAADGTLSPAPGTKYALALNGVELRAPVVARQRVGKGIETLYRVDGGPLRLRSAVTGVTADGWITGSLDQPNVARGSYTRYDVSQDGPGFAVLQLSRIGWCPSPGKRTVGRVTMRIGPVVVGPDKQPAIGHVTGRKVFIVKDCKTNAAALVPPNVPWRMEFAVTPTFSPHEVDPTNSDRRNLGAQVKRVGFQSLFGSG
jgi:hypothetical protein